jgi:sugar lactone lactonase YvrE
MGGEGGQHLSRISSDGALLDEVWVGGLANPTGLAWRGDKVLVVERRSVAIIDPATAEVTKRIPIPEGRLLNDIAVAPDGTVFVSDSRAGLIYRVGADDQAEKWLELDAGLNPNGVCIDGGKLYVGLNPVHRIIAVDLEDRSIEDHALLPPGLADGIEALGDGALAVSQTDGRLLRVTADGGVDALIDASGLDHPFADFDIAEAAGLVLVPTYYTGHVVAYSLPLE